MRSTRLTDTDLSGPTLTGASLVDADLKRAQAVRTDFERADLTRSRPEDGRLHAANLREARLESVKGRGCGLVLAVLGRADLRRARWFSSGWKSTRMAAAPRLRHLRWAHSWHP